MSPDVVVVLIVVLFLVLLAIEMPVAWALATSGGIGLIALQGVGVTQSSLGAIPYSTTAVFSLTVVPMFILMGTFALHGHIAEQLFNIAERTIGRIGGGLGVATVAACAGFAAVTGSSLATAATVGRIAVGEMRQHGYPSSFAVGIVAAAGTLGAMIPPSVLLVIYGIITGEPIGALLVAGIIPGIVSALLYVAYILVRGPKLVDTSRASGELGRPRGGPLPYRALFRAALLFTVVIGGIYSGVFTATESGALGALVALVLMLIELRRDGLAVIRRRLGDALREAASITSMSFAILVGAGIFTAFLVAARVPTRFTSWVLAFETEPWVVVVAILLIMIPFGMALDPLSILVITMPLAHPVVTALGFDGVWFGILVIKMIELGLITPPVGVNVYIVTGSVPGVTAEQGFKGVLPFGVVDLLTVAIFFVFPALVLWLPGRAGLV
jgi:C4-dicarboxylate transporter, DctM subunit